ncbi:NADP-dependent alcohol dehydrogenase [Cordyceps fumosorosea ARSEF 2679]|uniref:NADP-dependent alcohol dehydrogenase n=1 Tax=Cordyceps fumosorosea (strain ARSEF 2679) TaxID=1081104 RepID=A0A162IDL3_CORFA|nr:NADP-dependent alcohol dehydrogenase [Cordyceps fumosorosea ARSEF 2679]OAA55645.1 NADP-dependent alcohol dehydrogenase [Cordyceps fumosorosea ARSEF 2679]
MLSFTVYKGSPDGKPVKGTTTRPKELTGDQVLLKVLASGVCGTDLHYRKKDMVLGHEGVGEVQAVGPEVRRLRPGQRVGWGYQTGACGLCTPCLSGDETYCSRREMYGSAAPDQGSFATHAVWREAFLHALPEGLSPADAAPLQCGGATVFTALLGVRPTDTVGVLGVGGLGHLAIQFAAKMGCRVVVLSGSSRKREEALRLGGHRFIAMNDLKGKKGKQKEGGEDAWEIDRLLVTTSALPDWAAVVPMLAVRARIVPLSVGARDLVVPYAPVLLRGVEVRSALVATRAVHREMLAFAARHGVRPVVEAFPLSEGGAAEALDRLERGEVHFRAVLLPEGAEELEKHKI